MTGHPFDIGLLLAGALLAAALLGVLAGHWRLGADERLRDPATARDLACAADCTFVPAAVVVDRAGLGALLADEAGRIVLVRRHGARFVAHPVGSHSGIRLERNFMQFTLPEPGFTPITLDLGTEAQHWTVRLRNISRAGPGQ